MVTGHILHFSGIASAIAISAFSCGFSQAQGTRKAFDAMRAQIAARDAIKKNLFVGLVMTESAGILAILFAFIFFFGALPETIEQGIVSGMLGFGCALASMAVTAALGAPLNAALEATARQPFFGSKIMIFMILIQSTITIPLIFTFVVSLMVKNLIAVPINGYEVVKYSSSIAVVALSSFGPSIGQYFFGDAACRALGYSKVAYDRLFMYIFITAAVVETPFIFSLIISIAMMYKSVSVAAPWYVVVGCINSTICMVMGSICSSSTVGFIASKAAKSTGHDPENAPLFARIALMAQIFVESAAIYALLVSLLFLFKVE